MTFIELIRCKTTGMILAYRMGRPSGPELVGIFYFVHQALESYPYAIDPYLSDEDLLI